MRRVLATVLGIALLAGGAVAFVAGGPLWLRIPLIAGGAAAALFVARATRHDPSGAVGGDAPWFEPEPEELPRDEFEQMVADAVAALPDDISARMSNVAIVIEDEPPPGAPFLGLYRGYPLTKRTSWYSGAAPDKISIYRGPLERLYGHDRVRLAHEVSHTVRHEVAHHFGISDERLVEIDRY